MGELVEFEIPVYGLEKGEHTFNYKLQDDFFSHFEDSAIDSGAFEVDVLLNKKDNLYDFHFEVKGNFVLSCDRCLENYSHVVDAETNIIYKVTAKEERYHDEAEVIYVDVDTTIINIAEAIFESIHLQLPVYQTCASSLDEKVSQDCDDRVAEMLDFGDEDISNEEEEKGLDIWSTLKDLKINKNK